MSIELVVTDCSLADAVWSAIYRFIERDSYLIERGKKMVKEECVNHRIAHHLETAILESKNATLRELYCRNKISVDCEYSKHLDERKEMCGVVVRPDILLHERGTDDYNLICLEVKKVRGNKRDKVKIMAATSLPYKYRFSAVLDNLLEDGGPRLSRYNDGQWCRPLTLTSR